MNVRVRSRELSNLPFVRQSAIYMAGNVVNAAFPFLMMPVLTRYLDPVDYGIVGTATVLTQFLMVAIGLNASGLIVGSEFGDRLVQRRLVSTNLLLSGGVAACLGLVTLVAGGLFEQFTKFPGTWAPIVIFLSAATVVQMTYMALLQARNQAGWFIALQVCATVSNLGLSLWFVVGFGMGWRGRLIAMALSLGLMAAISLHGLIRRLHVLSFSFDAAAVRTLLAFGVPLVPHFVGGWIMTLAPRLYLNHLATLADTGLYSVGLTLASAIALLAGAGNQAYMPELFRRLSRPEGFDRLRLARILLLGATILPVLALAYGLAARWFLPLIVGPRFYAASPYVIWLALAFAIQGVYFIFGNFVVYSRRTSLMAWRVDFLGGLVMLAATPLLIWLSGPVGAAQATCLGFAVSCVGCITASRTAYPMPWAEAFVSLVGGGRPRGPRFAPPHVAAPPSAASVASDGK